MKFNTLPNQTSDLNKQSIELSLKSYDAIRELLVEEYGGPQILISFVTRKRIKCSFRVHADYTGTHYREKYLVDFYSEHAKTMFLMKYSEYIYAKSGN